MGKRSPHGFGAVLSLIVAVDLFTYIPKFYKL